MNWVVTLTFKLQYSTINLYSYPNIKMKANRKQTAVKLCASKIGTHIMAQVVTKYGKQCLHQVVPIFFWGHYLFREANSFPRAQLEKNCARNCRIAYHKIHAKSHNLKKKRLRKISIYLKLYDNLNLISQCFTFQKTLETFCQCLFHKRTGVLCGNLRLVLSIM